MKTDRSFDDLQLPQKFSPNSSGRHSRSSHFGLSPSPHPQTSVLSGSSQARWLTKILTLPTFSHFPVLAEDFPSASGIFPNPTPPPPAWPRELPPLPCGHPLRYSGGMASFFFHAWFLVLVSLISPNLMLSDLSCWVESSQRRGTLF